jgi:hypothetical protein
MSPSLCRNGNVEGASELERIWNELTHALPFFTVCPYSIDCFEYPEARSLFPNVCAEHNAVSQTRGFAQRSRDINEGRV